MNNTKNLYQNKYSQGFCQGWKAMKEKKKPRNVIAASCRRFFPSAGVENVRVMRMIHKVKSQLMGKNLPGFFLLSAGSLPGVCFYSSPAVLPTLAVGA
jgi:hypothetical protein